MGCIMGSPVGPGGRRPHSLSGVYLQDYASYGYEISWVDRSHQGGVQCKGINSRLLNFLVIALRLFSYSNFVRSISPKLYLLWV